jgi:hypothetical protein
MFLVILGVAGSVALAQPSYYECPDVPTDLPAGGTTFLPWDIVRNDAGAYSLPTSLPAPTPVDALHRLGTGDFLVSVEVTTTLGGVEWDRRDVFLFTTAGTFVGFPPYGGAVPLIPDGSNVDAAFVDPNAGFPVVSFDSPTTIAGITYDPADLVSYIGGGFALFFDASAAGILPGANLISADVRSGLIVFSLDVATTVAGVTYLPGELISWDGILLAVFDPQPGWPVLRSSRVDGLSFLADPGVIPPTITLAKIGAATLRISWSGSSCAGGANYGIYQGTIASLPVYDHTSIDCDDGGIPLQEDIALPPGSMYYLVAPHNDLNNNNAAFNDEGSYGTDNIGDVMTERPVGVATCVVNQVLGCSP